jgi:hypothetical protein
MAVSLVRLSFFFFFSRLPCSFSSSQHPLPSNSAVFSPTSHIPEMTEDDCISLCHLDSDSDSRTTDGARSEDESRSEFISDRWTTDVTEEHRTTDTSRRDLMPCVPEGLEDGESFSRLQITDTPNHDPELCPEQTRQEASLETRGTAEALGNCLSTYFCRDQC